MPDTALVARVDRMRDQVQEHKSAIAWHKRQLRSKAAALADLERELARRGIKLVVVPAQQGVEGTHGPSNPHT